MHHHTAVSEPIHDLPELAPSINGQAKPATSSFRSLKDALRAELPTGLNCKTRYVQSPPKPCEPLFSAMPGKAPEKTRLASHFLTVSVDAASLPQPGSGDVISFAIEVLVYTTKKLTTLFVSKVDSTSYNPRIKPSPIKTTVTAFLKWLTEKERRKRPSRKIVISLFARAQAQYLFPGSSDDKCKHVLDDRQLIKWWARVLDPIIPKSSPDTSHADVVKYQAYLTVPGYAKTELRSFMPPSSTSGDSPRWLPGNPLTELAHTRGIPEHAPPRCVLPRFPDDPKARFITDLDEEIGISQDSDVMVSPSKRKSGKWKSVMSLDQFWEQMEFRQECSSGRVVGFLWLVISPKKEDDDGVLESASASVPNLDSQESAILSSLPSSDSVMQDDDGAAKGSPKKKKRTRLTGPIIPRMPKVKSTLSNLSDMLGQLDADSDGLVVTQEGYDQAMAFMLQLDFSNIQIASRSTSKWVAELTTSVGLNADFAIEVAGTAKAESTTGKTTNSAPVVNDLGGMIKKKRKAPDSTTPADFTREETAGNEQPAVNVLGSGMIRKKPKPAME